MITLVVRRKPKHDDPKSRDCTFCYVVTVKQDDVIRNVMEFLFVKSHIFA